MEHTHILHLVGFFFFFRLLVKKLLSGHIQSNDSQFHSPEREIFAFKSYSNT